MLRTIISILIVLMFLVGTAWASPFLVCDEDPQAEFYLISFNGGAEVQSPAPLHYDLDGIIDGAHQLEIKAGNVWGESDVSPFGFTKALPLSAQGLGISSE